MAEYNVNVFLGTFVIEAEDEDTAEEMAYALVVEEWGSGIATNVAYNVEER